MKTTVNITGMHCGSCESKIGEALRGLPGVSDVSVSAAQGTATFEHTAPLDRGAVSTAVSGAGDYRVVRDDESETKPEVERESLYPLFLIVAFIAGTVALVAVRAGQFSLTVSMAHFMAGFFIVFSFFKMLDLRGFVDAYRGYDLLARRSAAWAWAYPFVELGLGVAYLMNVAPVPTNIGTLVLMLTGAAGVLRALLDKKKIRCACLGTALNLPMTKVTLVEDLTMAAMAAGMLIMAASA